MKDKLENTNERPRKRLTVRGVLAVIFALVFCFSAFMLARELIQAKKEQNAFDDLAQFVYEGVSTDAAADSTDIETDSTESGNDRPSHDRQDLDVLAKYAVLQQQNPYFYGWIRIDGTNVNYPVMYTPLDGEYYLRRAFDGTYSESGVPFLDQNCTEDGNCYLIYGHNMKNKSMFGQLPEYADRSFFEEHPVIRFDRVSEQCEYQVIAAFYSEIRPEDETGVFRYYRYTDLSDPDMFEEFMSQVRDAALYDTGIDAELGDTILILSTCSYHTDDGRFVVVAKAID